nr:DUF1800 family protein [Thermus thermophilus]
MGLEEAVDRLLRDPAPAPPYATRFARNQRSQQHREISLLWIEHWLTTPTPAAERLVLFWHGHFTSAFQATMGAQGVDFWNQFAMFRRLGYGTFGDLLKAVARDPVMLLYLKPKLLPRHFLDQKVEVVGQDEGEHLNHKALLGHRMDATGE